MQMLLHLASRVYLSNSSPPSCAGLRSTIERRGLKINKEFLAVSDEAQKVRAEF